MTSHVHQIPPPEPTPAPRRRQSSLRTQHSCVVREPTPVPSPPIEEMADDQEDEYQGGEHEQDEPQPSPHLEELPHSQQPAYEEEPQQAGLISVLEMFPGKGPHVQRAAARSQTVDLEALRKKWENCTQEEWEQGGRDLVERFEKVMGKVVTLIGFVFPRPAVFCATLIFFVEGRTGVKLREGRKWRNKLLIIVLRWPIGRTR